MRDKYNMNRYLRTTIGYEEVVEKLEKHYGISSSRFDQDRNICLGDPTPIPEERLNIYAEIFHVKPKDLKS